MYIYSLHRPSAVDAEEGARGSPSVSWLGLQGGWFVGDSLGRRCRRRLLAKLSLLRLPCPAPACLAVPPCTPALLAHDPALFLTATAALPRSLQYQTQPTLSLTHAANEGTSLLLFPYLEASGSTIAVGWC